MIRRLLPLLILLGVLLVAAAGLRRDPAVIPSTLVGSKAPVLRAPLLQDGGTAQTAALQALLPRGKPSLLNVWASWCTACLQEHAALQRLAAAGVTIFGLNYKDTDAAATAWLRERHNPYRAVFVDPQGTVGRDWGVYGVPETFVIDGQGVVRQRIVGPIDEHALSRQLAKLSR